MLDVLASNLAEHFHAGQKYGERGYFKCHIKGVVLRVKDNYYGQFLNQDFRRIEAICVAYLHDILEDTDCEIGTIINVFGHVIGEAVIAITKRKGIKRSEYLYAVKQNPLARFVKICDAEFNRDSCLYEGDTKRAEYYQDTIDYLLGE